ncbi:MAG: energy-coupling factor transporter ATPase [Clostridiales bacterium]|nr:energy-coupling factor transporter ATPase [Clostridiales bacterium]
MGNAISVQELHFSYPSQSGEKPVCVFDGLNVNIEEGSFVAILGHNGCGKSTFAKQCNAILLPEGGSVQAFGIDTREEDRLLEIRRTVGMVFQNPDNQMVANVVEEDVAFAPENLGVPSEEIRKRVDDALKTVGMYDYRTHAPHLLSGGQKQRIAIAGVIAMQPRCIVLDEPTAMLDPHGREDVMHTIEQLNRENGITVILITHHMTEAIRADRVIVMSEGRILTDGTPKEVFTQVELLRSAGLDVPATTQIIYELNKAGFDLPLDALSTEECAQALCEGLTTGGNTFGCSD